MTSSVSVLARSGAYRSVSRIDLDDVLSKRVALDVQHVNAAAAFGDPKYFSLIGDALRTSDARLLRATSRVCVRLRLHEHLDALRTASGVTDDALARNLLFAAVVYLNDED